MQRILVYDRMGGPLGEIAPGDVFAATLRETINGEHALELTTTQVLEKGTRLLHQDARGTWREFAVSGVDAEHAAGTRVVGDYYCPWSVQEDLMGVTVSVMPGVQTPTTAALALTSLLSTQSRWARGTVTNTATGGASMYDRSAWEALSVLVSTWGGEIDATIGVDMKTGVISRSVDCYDKQGDQDAKRRFDFGADVTGVTRTLADEPLYCRISPRGKGEETDAGGYGRKITIESVNSGKDYLEYSPMVDVAKIPNGSSGYIYPTKIVENSKMETPADLKTWAQSVLEAECTPKVSYSIDVLQSDEAGTSVQGVSLGDAVQVVDGKFGDGLRVQARVVSMTTDLVAERVTNVELGSVEEGISSKFAKVATSIVAMSNDLTTMSTAQYIDALLDRINSEINATGGYTYIVPGNGILTFDVAVADPLNPTEASQVVEIKGGSIRIANSKTSQGAWQWKTVFTSGHIAAGVVTAAQITTGYIGNSSNGNYWDIDNEILSSTRQGYTKTELSGGSMNFYYDNSGWQDAGSLDGSVYVGTPYGVTYGISYRTPTLSGYYADVSADASMFSVYGYGPNSQEDYIRFLTPINGSSKRFEVSTQCWISGALDVTSTSTFRNNVTMNKNLAVMGTKSRRVETGNYGNRLLYAYETPSPLFGDTGSGMLDEYGLCYVEVDDIFSETVRTDLAYQVFLQPCGNGSAWVEEKHMAYFVVHGTPGLAFDWEVKCRQTGYENTRIEQDGMSETSPDDNDLPDPLDMYGDYIAEIEALHVGE